VVEVNEALSLVPTVLSTIKSIQETCSGINPGFLPNNRQKLKDLEALIVGLEQKMQNGFPILASLANVYGAVAAQVKVAGALADKNAELLGFVDESKYICVFLMQFPGEMERRYIEVDKGLSDLPPVDSVELGEAQAIIKQIGTSLDRLKQLKFEAQDSNSVFAAKDASRQLIKDIASSYGNLDRVLSRLLKRIIENLGKTQF
jgi:hypothetical protein